MRIERLTPSQIRTLLVIEKAGGQVRSSNYHAHQPSPDGSWARHWSTLDSLVHHGLVICRYELTDIGRGLLAEASLRRWNLRKD